LFERFLEQIGRAQSFVGFQQPSEIGTAEKELFFQLAEAKAQDAQKYIPQISPLEARSQDVISEKLFRIYLEKDKDEDRLNQILYPGRGYLWKIFAVTPDNQKK